MRRRAPRRVPVVTGRWLGIDEAGRGSVLGPMAVGGFVADGGQLEALAATGVTDSKLLSPARREALIPLLSDLGEARVRLFSAREIDAANLNHLELEAMVELVAAFRPDGVIIDAPCAPAGIPNFKRALLARLDFTPELVVEPKADLNHLVVGAASVFAKVRRDAELTALGPVGSGYPHDPVTRAFLEGCIQRNEPLPDFVRTRWGTIRAMAQLSLPLGTG